jgi:putative glycosyltransferase (TIGR04372 family)
MKNILILRVMIHIARLLLSKKYRLNNSLISTNSRFFYGYGRGLAIIIKPFINNEVMKLKKNNTLVSVENIPDSIGHLTVELESLLRLSEENEQLKILYIYPKNKILKEISCLFAHTKIEIKSNGFLHLWYHIMAISNPEISISVSESSLNYVRGRNGLTTAEVFLGRIASRVKNNVKNPENTPFNKIIKSGVVDNKIFGRLVKKKYVVVQYKNEAVNATIEPLDSSKLIKALTYLKKLGYDIVLAGREKMPKAFAEIGVIDYANSIYANVVNDYYIVFNAEFIISSASGFNNIAEALDKPLLVYNTWHHVFMGSRKTLVLPRIIKFNDKILNCRDQLEFMLNCKTNEKNLPVSMVNLKCIDISSEDIYYSVKELLYVNSCAEPHDFTPLQKLVKSKFMDTPLGYGLSRIPNFYLIKHGKYFLVDKM